MARPIDEAIKLIQRNMNQRQYQTLIMPLIDALEKDFKTRKDAEVKLSITKVLNEVSDKLSRHTISLEDGTEMVNLSDLQMIFVNAKNNGTLNN